MSASCGSWTKRPCVFVADRGWPAVAGDFQFRPDERPPLPSIASPELTLQETNRGNQQWLPRSLEWQSQLDPLTEPARQKPPASDLSRRRARRNPRCPIPLDVRDLVFSAERLAKPRSFSATRSNPGMRTILGMPTIVPVNGGRCVQQAGPHPDREIPPAMGMAEPHIEC